MRLNEESFRVMLVNLDDGSGKVIQFGSRSELLGGSGLAAALFATYGLAEAPALDPRQPLIFTIGSLTGYFPLMSKCVLGFKSPYHEQYAESHAGGRLALAMRFAGYDAVVISGAARTPSCLVLGNRTLELKDVHYLWGQDVFAAGKMLRKICRTGSGHRSIIRIGPAGERRVPYAAINVDTYRHFGRLGGGAAMGAKNLKGMIVLGDGSFDLHEGKDYANLLKEIYQEITRSKAMKKYHDLGTAENLAVLNEMQALPWRNLQATQDDAVKAISGETFADQLLLRKTACAGCPVGCIHVGLLRESFAGEHEFLYRQVSYDYEPLFAAGSMLGMSSASDVMTLMDEIERQGLDVMSAGVALAWATEAMERGIITEKETLIVLNFGKVEGYRQAIRHLGARTNDFYFALGQGAKAAAALYGGEDFTCVLGQEMAGYATGEVFYASQAYGFRHSHLDSGGYSFDQKPHVNNVDEAVRFLLDDERKRVQLTCMVSCLFARQIYSEQRLCEALTSIGLENVANGLSRQTESVQARRWRLKFQTGYNPDLINIPKRLREVRTVKGPIDEGFLEQVCEGYKRAIVALV